ncbi:MAG: thiol:disulfide oxidoreductase [Alphaproteobacteria bacterium]|nr:MAG: thiol:disulfide oxidoreductase [Alphaproteobacteria bacterium]
MIDLHYWPTPNGHKVLIFLEEAGLEHTIHLVNIGNGEQFRPEFLAISPNNRMPAIVDHAPRDEGAAISVFESGAILLYLAHKTGEFGGRDPRAHIDVLQWLMWQVGGLGPTLGQNHHFTRYAPEKVPYAIDRYLSETARLYGVLDRQLAGRSFVTGEDYTVADMACFPWILPEAQGQDIAQFPNLARWHADIAARPAVIRALARGKAVAERA